MKLLPTGNRRSDVTVTPSNWNTKRASVKNKWQVQYRFYEKNKPPRLVVSKLMNGYPSLEERQRATTALIRQIEYDLDIRGYNPNTGVFELEGVHVNPNGTDVITGLKIALERVKAKRQTLTDMRSVLKGFTEAARNLVLDILPIGEIRAKHITLILEECSRINPRWSARRHNLYRAYLMRMFKELVKMEIVENNPVPPVEIMRQEKKIREVLSLELRQAVNAHLKAVDYNFWRFVHIFYHSGARETELLNLQIKDIDIENQRYKVLIEKGRQNKWVWKTIKTVALPLWREAIGLSSPDDYLFSVGIKAGKRKIGTDVLNRRWRKYVKIPFNTTADLYSLKHLNTTEIARRLGDEAAAKMNSHTTTGMVIRVYDIGREDRMHDFLKDVDNSFSDN